MKSKDTLRFHSGMATTVQLSRLFRALAARDLQSAEQLAIQIASDEEQKGHRAAAQLLKGSLVSNGTQSLLEEPDSKSWGRVPLLVGALSKRPSAVALDDVFLRKSARTELREIVKEFNNRGRLRERGIRRRSKLILHGPPGCGKSLAAHALANEAGLPLFVVRFDSIIGSYLGQTATHLRQLFQFAEATRCVLLFDEVDALGKRRGNPSDVGELDRIVIALMQELELSEVEGFVVATSNIPGSLDPALWRRFDLAVHLPRPNREELIRFAHSKAASFQLTMSASLLRRISRLGNYAETERAVEDEARRITLRSL